MSWLSRVVNVFRADRVSREIDEELQGSQGDREFDSQGDRKFGSRGDRQSGSHGNRESGSQRDWEFTGR
jgi:hypothetical protein